MDMFGGKMKAEEKLDDGIDFKRKVRPYEPGGILSLFFYLVSTFLFVIILFHYVCASERDYLFILFICLCRSSAIQKEFRL